MDEYYEEELFDYFFAEALTAAAHDFVAERKEAEDDFDEYCEKHGFYSVFKENPCFVIPPEARRKAKKTRQIFNENVPRREWFMRATTQEVYDHDRISHDELVISLHEAFIEARRHKRKTEDEIRFEFNLQKNLENLAISIELRCYRPSRGIAFIVTHPVIREIFAAPFRDRVVHHLLFALSGDWWDRRFIGNAYSCRKNKGTLYGWKSVQRMMRRCSHGGTVPATVQKCDISGYFMSLRRALLFERISWGLDRQFGKCLCLFYMTSFLWRQVIFDDPTKGVSIRGKMSDWDKLPRNKSLFHQKPGRGIVIGNLTSQLLSNIFLDQLDRFIKIELGYKYYGRYVDDFVFVVETKDKERLHEDLHRVALYLRSLGLKMHPKKCYCQPVENGVDFLGPKVYLSHAQPGRRVRANFHQALRRVAEGRSPKFEVITSYDGLFSHMKAYKMCKKSFAEVGWDYPER